MRRQTSIAVFRQIEAEGLLSTMRWNVYQTVFRHGPGSTNELAVKGGMRPHHVSTRLTELRDMGVVREVGTKTCSITGRNVICWDVTDKMPIPLVKTKGGKSVDVISRLRERVRVLEQENLELKLRLFGRKAVRRRAT